VLIDSSVFLCLAFQDPGWERCGQLLDEVFEGKLKCVVSAIQLSELYTPFMRAGDRKGLGAMKRELAKLRIKVRAVDRRVAELSSEYRSRTRTPAGKWISLADSIILATAKLERVETLYTLDPDFLLVKDIRVSAPGMPLEEWVRSVQGRVH
jgi:predicted nucleic acid-binding protein